MMGNEKLRGSFTSATGLHVILFKFIASSEAWVTTSDVQVKENQIRS